jgi:hypothetical protein
MEIYILLFILIFIIVLFLIFENDINIIIKRGGKEKEHKEKGHKEEKSPKEEKTHNSLKNIVINSLIITKPLLFDILNIIKKRHQTNTNFNVMTDDDISFYERQAHILENKYKSDYEIMKSILFSIRSSEMMIYISQCAGKIKSMSKIIKEDFENGFDLTLIADRHKLPYIMTLKQLLTEYKYSEKEIKRFLRGEKKMPDKIKSISAEIDFILKSDPTSSINSLDKKDTANNFEKTIAEFLDKEGVKYISENEMRKNNKKNKEENKEENKKENKEENKKENKEDAITPDFLLKGGQSVSINGYPINWVEVKNYAYYGNKILEKGIQKQATKYHNKYGNGVFIFKHGVSMIENTEISGVKFIGWGEI